MRAFAAALLSLLVLGGCGSWNEQTAKFTTFADFQASKYANGGHMPTNLVPASARDIHVLYNIDSTEIEVSFDFDRAEAERVIFPFRTPEQIRIRELQLQGRLPPDKVTSPLLIRCTPRMVEFLQITDMTRAHYHTAVDPTTRKTACQRVDAAPMIAI